MSIEITAPFQLSRAILASCTLHHASVRLARVQIRHTQAYALAVDHHVALYKPLIPNLAVVRLSPEADFDFRVSRQLHGVLWDESVNAQDGRDGSIVAQRTLRGKRMGNHEIMSLLFWSMVTGFVLSSTGPSDPLYSTVSKYAPSP